MGLEHGDSGWRVCLKDAEPAAGHDEVPTDTHGLGKATHSGENSHERLCEPRNADPFDPRSCLRMVCVRGSLKVFIQGHSLAQLSRDRVHGGTDSAESLVEVVDRE